MFGEVFVFGGFNVDRCLQVLILYRMFVLLRVGPNLGTKCSQPKINFLLLKQADRGFAAYVFRQEVPVHVLGMLECFLGGGSINSYGIACSIAIPPLAVGRSVSLINEL
jgi:hypothetical protein